MLKFISNYFINKYKQTPEYRDEALKFAFESQSKPKGFQDMQFVFTDSNGKHYYRYINDVKIPIVRVEGIQKSFLKLCRRLDKGELEQFVQAAKDELNHLLTHHKNGKINALDLTKINYILDEMTLRDEVLLHEPLLMEIAAHLNIREDEDPFVFDETILEEKVEQFKKDSKGGLKDFFYKSGLSVYSPLSNITESEWEKYYTVSQEIMTKRNQLIQSLISEAKSANSTKAELKKQLH